MMYVTTPGARAAVKGRETEVLDALGIDWRSGRPHVRCPYTSHSDNNASWRWDEKRLQAICTCTPKADSIFDVVMKVAGIDFDTAKIRVAELLKLEHLIRMTGEANGQRFQAPDAESLMNAPDDRRDDHLPAAYLAHRLGIDPGAVPIPSTRMIGLNALGYYDPPPQGSKAKPKLVGELPCAVFGTVAADGGTHAHRIYLAAGGAGKADLGDGPDGRPRNPKKSAKVVGDDNTAGRSVIWGDPGTAPDIVVAEGIETACAIAFALGQDVEAGEVAVAAAISAGGIEAFQPYPATTKVTVAADRDEAPKADGRPGSRRGERAARTFGLRNYEKIEVAIALPGVSGESIDFLDLLRRDGVDLVRATILGLAHTFTPTDTETEEAAQAKGRAAELREVAETYPLPAMNAPALSYDYTGAGAIRVHKWVKVDGEAVQIPVATPFGVPARLRHIDQADSYGLRCVVQDMDDKPRAIDFDRAALAKMHASDIRSQLFAAGLRTEGDGEMIAVAALKAADPDREILIVARPGWQEHAGLADPIFITPKGEVIGAPDGTDLELASAARMPAKVAENGSLDGWRAAAVAAVSVADCQHWILGVVGGFAGPLVALTGLDTCGINLSGLSSSGKTLAQRLAASVWSVPDVRKPGLLQSARATDNAIEALAQRASGTVLSLDELAHVSGKQAAKFIYTIAGGAGKRRMSADATERPGYTWSTFAIFSGECSLEEKIRADGGEWVAGMAVRIVDVDVTGVNRQVDADTLRAINDIDHHYGHAGPAFVRTLIERGLHRQASALRDRILKTAQTLAGDGSDSATIRAATPLALLLIAGELAKGFGLILATADIQGAVKWAWDRFRKSSDAMALDPEAQMLATLRGWIAERWNVTIKDTETEGGLNNREAVAWYDATAIYLPKERIREAAGSALKESHIGAVLDRRGLLTRRPEGDRLYVRWVPQVGKVAAYALSRKEFGRSKLINEPVDLTVHEGGRQ